MSLAYCWEEPKGFSTAVKKALASCQALKDLDLILAVPEHKVNLEQLRDMPLLVEGWDAGIDTILRSAPCLVVAMAPSGDRNGMVNLTLALFYLELTAPLYGIGTCWAGLLQAALMSIPELKQQISIPADYPFHYPMMIGYAKRHYYRLPQRKAPRISRG